MAGESSLATSARRDDDGCREMTADYEALRQAALRGEAGGPRLGRAVVERAGLVAWMEAWSAAAPTPQSGRLDVNLVAAPAADAVQILAGMALAVIGGGR